MPKRVTCEKPAEGRQVRYLPLLPLSISVHILCISFFQQWKPKQILRLTLGKAEFPTEARQAIVDGHVHPAPKLPDPTSETASVRIICPAGLTWGDHLDGKSKRQDK